MDIDPITPNKENQITSSMDISPADNNDSSTNQQTREQLSTTECPCHTEASADSPKATVGQAPFTSLDDTEIEQDQSSNEADIHQFMEDFKDFHTLMIQLNESQYFARHMDSAYVSLEADLFDLMEELAYRRAEEAEELRQKAELDELLKSIKDDDDDDDDKENVHFGKAGQKDGGQTDNAGQDDEMDENDRVAKEVMEDLLNKIVEENDKNNDEINEP